MSLSTHNASLTTNAKASGKKLTLKVIKNLDTDRQTWLSEVVMKSSLLGSHDTIRTQWVPIDEDQRVKIIGLNQKQINSSSTRLGKTSTSTSSKGGGDAGASTPERNKTKTDTSRQAGSPASVSSGPKDRETTAETKQTRSSSSRQGETPSRSTKPFASVKTEGEENNDEMSELKRLRTQLEWMEIQSRLKEFEFAQALTQAKQKVQPTQGPTDKHHRGLYGLREADVVENLIQAEFDKQKTWIHPVSNREETPNEREIRMILYDMIVTSLQNFKSMYTGELVGDNYAIVRNVMKYGAPNSMRMKIDLTKRLGNYAKKSDQGYQDFELGLRNLVDELTAVGNPVSEADLTLRLIAGMLSDKRYEKECKEVSDQAEPYFTCHHVFMQRAQALGDLVTHKSREEANAATTDRKGGGKGKEHRGRDSDGGHDDGNRKRNGETDGAKGTTATKSKVNPCTYFLIYGKCGREECDYDHLSPDDVKEWRVKHGIDNPDGTPKKHKARSRRGRTKRSKAKRKESESDDSEKEKATGSEDTEDGQTSESDYSSVKEKRKKSKKGKDKKQQN